LAAAIVITGILWWWLFTPMRKTKIRVEVKVTGLEMVIEGMSVYQDKFNFYLPSADSQVFVVQDAAFRNSAWNKDAYMPLNCYPLDRASTLTMNRLHFEQGMAVRLVKEDPHSLQLAVSQTLPGRSGRCTFDVHLQNWGIDNRLTKKRDTCGEGHDAPNNFQLSRTLDSGRIFNTTFYGTLPWKWPPTLYVRSLSFSDNNSTRAVPVSSILSGKINLLQTNDSAHVLFERDVLKLALIRPAEVFLQGDSTGITVRFEGEVSSILAGPRIMEDENDRMPTRIQTMNDKAPYIFTICSLVASFLGVFSLDWLIKKVKA